MGAITEVRSESAYDALQDSREIVVRLLSRPASLDELVAVDPTQNPVEVDKRLKRLIRTGLVQQNGERFEALAQIMQQTRQEGIVSSLSRYILPLFTNVVQQPEGTFVAQLDLHLSVEAQASLRQGPIQDVVVALDRLTTELQSETKPCVFAVVGTSDVPPPGDDPGDRLLETIRRAARQRSIPDVAQRAVLTQQEAYFDVGVIPRAEALVRELAKSLDGRRANGAKPNYTLAFAFGPHSGMEEGK